MAGRGSRFYAALTWLAYDGRMAGSVESCRPGSGEGGVKDIAGAQVTEDTMPVLDPVVVSPFDPSAAFSPSASPDVVALAGLPVNEIDAALGVVWQSYGRRTVVDAWHIARALRLVKQTQPDRQFSAYCERIQMTRSWAYRLLDLAKDSDRYKVFNLVGVTVCNSIPRETHRGPARVRPSVPWSP